MKQETLEEAAEIFIKKQNFNSLEIDDKIFEAILFGAKWQQERSYSEEEVKLIAKFAFHAGIRVGRDAVEKDFDFDIWFEKFKKK